MRTDAFREYCAQTQLRSAAIDLKVGDMYFFKADSVHEIPAFTGDKARMNLGDLPCDMPSCTYVQRGDSNLLEDGFVSRVGQRRWSTTTTCSRR